MSDQKLIGTKEGVKLMDSNEAYECFQRFVYALARRFENTGENINDLVQIACIGFLKAFNSYDISKGVLFMTYIAPCVNNQILMHLRKKKNALKEVSFEYILLNKTNEEIFNYHDIIQNSINFEEDIFFKILIKEVKNDMEKAKTKHKQVFQLYYFEEMTQLEIAKKLNWSQSYVSRVLKNNAAKIRKKYIAEEVNGRTFNSRI